MKLLVKIAVNKPFADLAALPTGTPLLEKLRMRHYLLRQLYNQEYNTKAEKEKSEISLMRQHNLINFFEIQFPVLRPLPRFCRRMALPQPQFKDFVLGAPRSTNTWFWLLDSPRVSRQMICVSWRISLKRNLQLLAVTWADYYIIWFKFFIILLVF